MRVVRVLGACSLGGLGHLRPLGSVLDMLRDRGDTVAVVVPPAMADQVASAVVALGASMPVVQVAISLAEVEWGSISAAAPLPDWWPEMAAMPVLLQVIADRVV